MPARRGATQGDHCPEHHTNQRLREYPDRLLAGQLQRGGVHAQPLIGAGTDLVDVVGQVFDHERGQLRARLVDQRHHPIKHVVWIAAAVGEKGDDAEHGEAE